MAAEGNSTEAIFVKKSSKKILETYQMSNFSLRIYPLVCHDVPNWRYFQPKTVLIYKVGLNIQLILTFCWETAGNLLGLWQAHWGTTFIWYSESFNPACTIFLSTAFLWSCVLKVKRRNLIFRNFFIHLAIVQNWTFHFSPSSSCQLYSSCPGWFSAWFLSNVSHKKY